MGFIIGIEGKNINKIRDNSGAKIDVFQENIGDKFRQIELAGSVSSLVSAADQIYRFVNRYYYYNSSNPGQNEIEINNSEIFNSSNKNAFSSLKLKSNSSVSNNKRKASYNDEYNDYQKNRKERIEKSRNVTYIIKIRIYKLS